ncbi:hypothetical protein HOLleu_14838 [Holothuria leucospilota]|uniref:Uncharacterized protein n=1 Tax=Holothuria leucospilota TaxID=206669 RepID=A0A9Q1C976_HOLLE|nr:hypothetical protein HOLleu_14838 [Holothuria leucospilota]
MFPACLALYTNNDFEQADRRETCSRIHYTSAELRAIGTNAVCCAPLVNMSLPKAMRRCKRGKPGGVRRRNRNRKSRPYLPHIIMGNVQSLVNKIDELSANTRFLSDFRNANIMSFTETWLTNNHFDAPFELDGFKLIRGDRSLEDTGKKSGGGVCVYVNHRWCHPSNVFIKKFSCTPNLEMLTVSIRPYYLPREFSHILHCTIYIPNQHAAQAGNGN